MYKLGYLLLVVGVVCLGWMALPRTATLAQQVAAEAPEHAPPIVDMAAKSYPWYGNEYIDDCPQATMAEDLQTIYGVEPTTAAVVAAYHHSGTSLTALTSYMKTTGLAGYRLIGSRSVELTKTAIEQQLNAHHPLFAVTLLPDEEEAHAWLVVGYSVNGPIMASWARLLYLGWPRFLAETSGIWRLTWAS